MVGQPALLVLEEGDRYLGGASSIRTDFSTISEAYSHDWETMPIRTSASRVIPRMPQWMSLNWLP